MTHGNRISSLALLLATLLLLLASTTQAVEVRKKNDRQKVVTSHWNKKKRVSTRQQPVKSTRGLRGDKRNLQFASFSEGLPEQLLPPDTALGLDETAEETIDREVNNVVPEEAEEDRKGGTDGQEDEVIEVNNEKKKDDETEDDEDEDDKKDDDKEKDNDDKDEGNDKDQDDEKQEEDKKADDTNKEGESSGEKDEKAEKESSEKQQATGGQGQPLEANRVEASDRDQDLENSETMQAGTETTSSPLDDGDEGIIGGQAASLGEFPFYVKFEGNTLCGGSMISNDTILTAAHCINNGKPPSQVRLGATGYYGGDLLNTKCAMVHPDFIENRDTLMNDVAIVKLQSPISNTQNIVKYNTDPSYPSADGTPLNVIGFGLTSNSGSVSNTLQKLTTSFVSIDECIASYPDDVVTEYHHICADINKAGDCNGDSGGPVFDNNRLQVGIVSFGYGGCAADKFQDVYVNVATYADWITSYKLGEDCEPFVGPDPTDAPTDPTDPPADDGTDGDADDGDWNDDKDDNFPDGGDDSPTGDGSTVAPDPPAATPTNPPVTAPTNPPVATTPTDPPVGPPTGSGSGGDTDTDGTDEDDEDEPTSDLDTFLDCFKNIMDLVKDVVGNVNGGGGDNGKGDAAGGGGDAGKGGADNNEAAKGEGDAAKGRGNTFLRNYQEIAKEGPGKGRVIRTFIRGIRDILGGFETDEGEPVLPGF